MNNVLSNIKPQSVFSYFEEISRIPRGSKNEKSISDYLYNFGKSLGLETIQDEALNIIISSLTKPGDYILCENPTHNVSLKIFKSYNLNILPMNLDKNNLDFESINDTLKKYKGKIKFVYITPSYNNPTGIVLSPEDRFKFYNIMKENNIAIIEDGFIKEPICIN